MVFTPMEKKKISVDEDGNYTVHNGEEEEGEENEYNGRWGY